MKSRVATAADLKSCNANGQAYDGLDRIEPFPSFARPEGRCEDAITRRVHRRHGCEIRYVPPWGKFLCWDGRRWKLDDGPIIDAMIRGTTRELWTEIDVTRNEIQATEFHDVLRTAKSINTARGKNAIRDLLKSEPGVAVNVDELDRPTTAFNCIGGTIDLRNGSIVEHDRDMLLTKLSGVIYDPAATCPTWDRFIAEILPGDGLAEHVQRVVGYWLTGSVAEHKLFLLWGKGSNGKSVFCETLLALAGEYGIVGPADLLMAKQSSHPTELAQLYGYRLVICQETEETSRLAEARVKQLTGGDTLTARRMREDFWTFRPTHHLVLCTNHRPRLHGTDLGLRRRLHLIPFTVTIPPERQDKSLAKKLRGELSGILNWIIAGALAWQRDGLGEPAAVKSATGEYIESQDAIGLFIDERCVVATWAKVKAGQLYDAYRNWCEERGESYFTQTRFGTSIEERGYVKRKSSVYWYDGIGLGQLGGAEG